jgi:hypothetical protein
MIKKKKENNMLPFIAGIAAGVVAVVAINNRKEIKKKVIIGAEKVKEKASDVKECVVTKVENLTSKKEKVIEEEIPNVE